MKPPSLPGGAFILFFRFGPGGLCGARCSCRPAKRFPGLLFGSLELGADCGENPLVGRDRLINESLPVSESPEGNHESVQTECHRSSEEAILCREIVFAEIRDGIEDPSVRDEELAVAVEQGRRRGPAGRGKDQSVDRLIVDREPGRERIREERLPESALGCKRFAVHHTGRDWKEIEYRRFSGCWLHATCDRRSEGRQGLLRLRIAPSYYAHIKRTAPDVHRAGADETLVLNVEGLGVCRAPRRVRAECLDEIGKPEDLDAGKSLAAGAAVCADRRIHGLVFAEVRCIGTDLRFEVFGGNDQRIVLEAPARHFVPPREELHAGGVECLKLGVRRPRDWRCDCSLRRLGRSACGKRPQAEGREPRSPKATYQESRD